LLLHNATGLYPVSGILDEPMHVITMHPCQGIDNVNTGSMAFTHLSTQTLRATLRHRRTLQSLWMTSLLMYENKTA
jgi:hypothetical protein